MEAVTLETEPAMQLSHVASDVSPVPVEYFPREHSQHAPDPFTGLYSPASHAEHSVPSGPVYPILHTQSPISVLPCSECV